jgi:hypothetical protein
MSSEIRSLRDSRVRAGGRRRPNASAPALIPRESQRSVKLYRSRGAVEREFGRLKHEWAIAPLRIRRLGRVRLHVDLPILAKLATRLASERAVALAA